MYQKSNYALSFRINQRQPAKPTKILTLARMLLADHAFAQGLSQPLEGITHRLQLLSMVDNEGPFQTGQHLLLHAAKYEPTRVSTSQKMIS